MKKKIEVLVLGRDIRRFPVESLLPYNVTEVTDLYQLKSRLTASADRQIITIQYCSFLDDRHLNAFQFLLKEHPDVMPLFVAKEIGSAMKERLRNEPQWKVFWSTDRIDISQLLEAQMMLVNREAPRKDGKKDVLVGPSSLEKNSDLTEPMFKPYLGAISQNISSDGVCITVPPQSPYKEKDFISLNYRKEDGDYVSMEGQVRWVARGKKRHLKVMGVKFVGKA